MRQTITSLMFLFSLLCLIPNALHGSTVSFLSKTQGCANNCYGAPFYYHADLNNDGREDLIYSPSTYFGQIGYFVVQLSNGDGTYAPAVTYSLPNSAVAADFGVADFSGDGNADVAVFATDNNVYLFRNTGSGALMLAATYPFASGNFNNVSVGVGDYNHDGIEDLVYLSNGVVHVWFGNGKSGFTPGPATAVNNTQLLASGVDFDGDGIADLALSDYNVPTTISVLYGDGTGHFLKTTNVAVGRGAYSVGDVNSDGKMDLLVSPFPDTNAKYIAVYYGDSARSFVNHTTIPTTRCPSAPASTADLDGNGINDLVIPESACGTSANGTTYIDVRTRNSNASYNAEQTIYTAPPTNGVTYQISLPEVLRADRNTEPDLLLTHCLDDHCSTYETTDLLNTTSGNFPSCYAPNSFQGINICSPVVGSSPYSPVPFAVGASGPVLMRKVEVWVDGKKLVEQLGGFSHYSFLNHSLSLTPGSHAVTVYAAGWDNWLERRSFTLSVK